MSISTNVPQDEAPDHLESGTQQQQPQQPQTEEVPDVQQSSSSSSTTAAEIPAEEEQRPISSAPESPEWLSPSQAARSVVSAEPSVVSQMSSVFQQRMGAPEPHTATLAAAPKTPTTTATTKKRAIVSKLDPSTPIGLVEGGGDDRHRVSELPFVIKDLGDFGIAPPTPTSTPTTDASTSSEANDDGTNGNANGGGEVLRDFSSRRPFMNDKMQGILKSRGLFGGGGAKQKPGDNGEDVNDTQSSSLSRSNSNDDTTTTTTTMATSTTNDPTASQPQQHGEEEVSLYKQAKKATVGVVGGAMTAVGLVMIPLPTPFGVVIAGSGLAVLGTEFPAAKQVLETSRDKLVEVIETHVVTDNDDEEENAEGGKETTNNKAGVQPVDKITTAANQDLARTTKPMEGSGDIAGTDDNIESSSFEEEHDDESTSSNASSAVTPPAWLSSNNGLPSSEDEFQKFSNRHPEVPPELQTSLEETWKKYRKQASRVGRKVIPVLKKIGTTSASSSFDEDGNCDTNVSSNDGAVDADGGTASAATTDDVVIATTDTDGTNNVELPSPQSRQVFV